MPAKGQKSITVSDKFYKKIRIKAEKQKLSIAKFLEKKLDSPETKPAREDGVGGS